MKTLKKLFIYGVLSTGLMTGCSQGFRPLSSEVPTPNDKKNEPGTPGGGGTDIKKAAFVATMRSQYPSIPALEIDTNAKVLYLRLPLPINPDGSNFEVTFPDVAGTRISLIQKDPLTYVFTVEIPLQHIKLKGPRGKMSGLPSGDPLPGVSGGQMSMYPVNFGRSSKAYFYLGDHAAGLFVPTPGFDPTIRVDFPIFARGTGQNVGLFSQVPAKNKVDGGFFILCSLPEDISKVIENGF